MGKQTQTDGETSKTNLRKWQETKLREVLRTVEKTASIHHSDKSWNEADFNLWAKSWVIPKIKEVLGGGVRE